MLRKLTNCDQGNDFEVLEKAEMLEQKAAGLLSCFSRLFSVAKECESAGDMDMDGSLAYRLYEDQRVSSNGIL